MSVSVRVNLYKPSVTMGDRNKAHSVGLGLFWRGLLGFVSVSLTSTVVRCILDYCRIRSNSFRIHRQFVALTAALYSSSL